MLTPNEIYKKLGLEDPSLYAEKRFKEAKAPMPAISEADKADWARRRSGRSFRSYIDLISHLSKYPEQNVHYVCPYRYDYHIKTIKELIQTLNINLDENKVKGSLEPVENQICFFDHYYFECNSK